MLACASDYRCARDLAEVVELLLADHRVNPAANGNEARKAASKNARPRTVQLLLGDFRMNPAVDNNVVLYQADNNGHPENVSVLLEDPRMKITDEKCSDLLNIAVKERYG